MIGSRGIPALFGGVERHVEVLSKYIARRGYKIVVYSRKWFSFGQPEPKQDNVKRVVLPSIHTKSFDVISHTAFSIFHAMRQGYDIIHFHGVGPALLAWIPRLFTRARIVVTVHSLNRLHPQWGWFARLMLYIGEWAAIKFAHDTIVVSKNLRTYFRRHYRANTTVIPNGIDIPKHRPSTEPLKQWNLKSGNYLVFVGRLVKTKGIHTAVDAWKLLRKKHDKLLDNLKFVIVGDVNFSDGYVKELRAVVGKDSSVVFTGWQEGASLHSLIAHAKLFIQPSLSEGLPIALLEAMSYGLPVLVSDIPAHRELVAQKEARFPVEDEKALSELIARALEDPGWYEKLGEKNLEIVREEYQWDVVARKTLEVYRK